MTIQITNLTFSYPGSGENVFEDVSFQIDTTWKTGLIGRNGRGQNDFAAAFERGFQNESTGDAFHAVSQIVYFPCEVMGHPA